MTVLAKYQRLEAEGIWRSDPLQQRRDVIVSIGDATLVLSDMNGVALTHWSLPAIERKNPGTRPGLFAPGEDSPEILEIADTEMMDAIAEVLRAIERQRARPGRIRGLTLLVLALAAAFLTVVWLPGALARYTSAIVPEAARDAIGRDLLAQVRRVTGAPCNDAAGAFALKRVQTRLFPGGDTTLVVLPSALAETAHLPGGTILISHRLVEDFQTPEVLAGYLIAEDVRRRSHDPMVRLLNDVGVISVVRMLTTGKLPVSALAPYAEGLIGSKPEALEDSALLAGFATVDVPSTPYAFARDVSGETTLPLIEATDGDAKTPVLSDGNWIALQKICEG